MTKRVLVLGGTRYVGKRLVLNLLKRGFAVTVATRGRTLVSFKREVQWLHLDRFDKVSLQAKLGQAEWDIVYDQLCYAPSDAEDIRQVLSERVGRYIFSSSQAVYDDGRNLDETAFDPYHCAIQMGRRSDFEYAEGKRLAEAVLLQRASFPVVAVRFPIVLGIDDYTQRLHVQVQRVIEQEPLYVYQAQTEISLIESGQAADFLLWLAEYPVDGPVNACADGTIALGGIVALIEQVTNQQATIVLQADDDPFSLFGTTRTLTLDTTKAKQAGYGFEHLEEWLPKLVQAIAVQAA
ncbi:MAG: NAD-dependent epimerase/dehydratase family protein [Chloroflexi bacterium]|nr:NAD-dependent epimerase/dehydratase family protein [Chloroflexota bacterium]